MEGDQVLKTGGQNILRRLFTSNQDYTMEIVGQELVMVRERDDKIVWRKGLPSSAARDKADPDVSKQSRLKFVRLWLKVALAIVGGGELLDLLLQSRIYAAGKRVER